MFIPDLIGVFVHKFKSSTQQLLLAYEWDEKSEVIGKHFSQFIPTKSAKEFSHLLERITNGETISNLKTDRLTKSGETAEQLISINPIFDKNEIAGLEGFILDLKHTEELK